MTGSAVGISNLERQAVLDLRPFFSKDPIVFDIGSNKGGWADILIENVAEMHLFEPNGRLLTYTMVKYDYLKNVHYNQRALFSKVDYKMFTYFTNENNGLSNLFQNPKWDHLPHQMELHETSTIDLYRDEHFTIDSDPIIDFIKIDVEGAEFDVLLGAAESLKRHKIRFIQIEYSEHYPLSGYTFIDVINFVEQFGYTVYSYDGQFTRVTTEDFVEDYRLENFWIMLEFTQNWNAEFKKNTRDLPKFETVLEIGCFEGLTTNYICDNLLTPNGRVICIDPLTDEYLPGHPDNEMFKGQYERFVRNTAGRPVELIRKKSAEAYNELKDFRFGLIYVDGDHTENGVFSDAVAYWNLLLDSPREHGGYMLFDDYGQSEATRRGIDRFLKTQVTNYRLLIKGYQVLIQRLW